MFQRENSKYYRYTRIFEKKIIYVLFSFYSTPLNADHLKCNLFDRSVSLTNMQYSMHWISVLSPYTHFLSSLNKYHKCLELHYIDVHLCHAEIGLRWSYQALRILLASCYYGEFYWYLRACTVHWQPPIVSFVNVSVRQSLISWCNHLLEYYWKKRNHLRVYAFAI